MNELIKMFFFVKKNSKGLNSNENESSLSKIFDDKEKYLFNFISIFIYDY